MGAASHPRASIGLPAAWPSALSPPPAGGNQGDGGIPRRCLGSRERRRGAGPACRIAMPSAPLLVRPLRRHHPPWERGTMRQGGDPAALSLQGVDDSDRLERSLPLWTNQLPPPPRPLPRPMSPPFTILPATHLPSNKRERKRDAPGNPFPLRMRIHRYGRKTRKLLPGTSRLLTAELAESRAHSCGAAPPRLSEPRAFRVARAAPDPAAEVRRGRGPRICAGR
eukprot:gene383-biopygen10748